MVLLRIYFTDAAFDFKAIHKPLILSRGDQSCFIRSSGPAKAVAFCQPEIDQAGTSSFKDDPFNTVSPGATEEEQSAFFQWFQTIVQANIRCQTIDSPAKIDSTTADDHLFEAAIPKHAATLS